MNVNFGLKGEYKVMVKDSNGNIKSNTGWMKNIITSVGLDHLFIVQDCTKYCVVGTGSATPVAANVSLQSKIGSVATGSARTKINGGAPSYNIIETRSYEFASGGIVGNIAEVGVGPLSSGENLFSRALLVDTNNTPTVISVLSTDTLTIIFKITVSKNINDATQNISILGVPTVVTIRPAFISGGGSSYITQGTALGNNISVSFYDGAIGASSSLPSGNSSGSISGAGTFLTPYTAGAHSATLSFFASLGQANLSGGIGAAYFGGTNAEIRWQYGFNPPIAKDNTKTLTFNITISYTSV
jgi:hypothetical protein